MDNLIEQTAECKIDLAGEVLLLGFFGKLLITYPNPNSDHNAWIKYILDEDLFSEIPFASDQEYVQEGKELLQQWTENCKMSSLENCILDMRLDHTHLFGCIGEILAPPWESVYFNKKRLVNQIQLMQVRQWYKKYGLSVEKDNQEPDDHIGFELLFLAFLASQALKEYQAGNIEKYHEFIQAQKSFYLEHLHLWGGIWCDQVIQHARTHFYRGIAFILKGVLVELNSAFE